jgi:hypothetical protein
MPLRLAALVVQVPKGESYLPQPCSTACCRPQPLQRLSSGGPLQRAACNALLNEIHHRLQGSGSGGAAAVAVVQQVGYQWPTAIVARPRR